MALQNTMAEKSYRVDGMSIYYLNTCIEKLRIKNKIEKKDIKLEHIIPALVSIRMTI